MCRAVYTPLNSKISRFWGRHCSRIGSCQRRVPLPHGQLRLSRMTRASAGIYICLEARRPGGPPDGLAGSRLTPEELARRQGDREARLRLDTAELAVSSHESTRGYADAPLLRDGRGGDRLPRDETHDPATPSAAKSRVIRAPAEVAPTNPIPVFYRA
jgi:hypothetical protein